jgi:hypothetical protein
MNEAEASFYKALGISVAGVPNNDFTDQELRMWVVELLIENNGSVKLPDADALVRFIKTGEV